jgi:class 3 adenylate cyclase/tetratricopeptide (TPR) repeat protein
MVQCPACGRENPEGFRFCGSCGAALPAEPTGEVRKTVTVLFADVVSSTALGERHDPESLRRVMARHFDEARAAIERHGGTVEKFIGDAVMAVFGIPTVHEDDALRAVRAADDIRSALAGLNQELERDWAVKLEIRIGLNTGEVVAGRGQTLVTGDPVNVAKRLEEGAGTGEILVGEATHRLVRDAVEAEAVQPLALKGKGETVGAFRVLTVHEGVPGRERRLDSPMVGRERERTLLQQAFERAVGEHTCHLFTVLGAAGVGKSRLVAEFLDGLGEGATVVRGRCLSYGEGITFWPLLEIVRRLYGEDLVSMIAARLTGDENAQLIADRVASAVGLAQRAGPSEETFWAVRKLFESHAQERPLVVVFDDIQWGEPTFLDLIEHVADLSRDSPILLVCLARPEFLDERPGWGGGKFNATSVLLEPLSDDDSAQLIDNLLGRAELAQEARLRVSEAAEGNPLFVEEMLGMLIDDGLLERRNGSWIATGDLSDVSVPPTIQALLAARLDRLAADERAVAERASVEGNVFHRGAVAELSPSGLGEEVGRHLQALVRKELVRPDRSEFAGDDAFRFRHLLIRDAAYAAMPKELRAELHERFAAWLERAAGERVAEYEEILGYHLEQAYRYRTELGPADEDAKSVASKAGEHLAAAGERAMIRGDAPGAVSLIDRAVELLPPDSSKRPKLLCDLGLALADRGEFERATTVLSEANEAAQRLSETAAAATARLRLEWVGLLRADSSMEEAAARVEQLARELDEMRYETGLAEAWFILGVLRVWKGVHTEGMEVFERAASLGRVVGNARIASQSTAWLLLGTVWGPLPVSESLDLCDRVMKEFGENPYLEGYARVIRGTLHAMAGRWDDSRAQSESGWARLDDLGQHVSAAATRMPLATTQIVAGRAREAERELRVAYAVLERLGEKGYLSTIAALLGLALSAQGRHGEAEAYAREGAELAAPDDLATQSFQRAALAEVLASRGEHARVEALTEEALKLLEGTDMLLDQAAILKSQAVAFAAAGQRDRARAALEQAIGICEQKEFTSGVAHLKELAAEL